MPKRDLISVEDLSRAQIELLLDTAESILDIAECEDAAVHVCHVSTASSLAAIAALDPNLKMNPPLRAESDRKALVAALKSGLLNCVATDHAPHAAEEKDVPFEEAPFGCIGLDTAFSVLHGALVGEDLA